MYCGVVSNVLHSLLGSRAFSLRDITHHCEGRLLLMSRSARNDLLSGNQALHLCGQVGNRVRVGLLTNIEAPAFLALAGVLVLVWVVIAKIPQGAWATNTRW